MVSVVSDAETRAEAMEFRQLLNNPPTSSLWGSVTLDFDKVKDSESPRAVVEVVCSMQWLCQRLSATERVQILATTDAESHCLVEVCLAVLERSAKEIPALELHIEGELHSEGDSVDFCDSNHDYQRFPEYRDRDWDYFVKEEAQ
ncbi:hypothetical protein WJX72_004512 [[Myrmecia] bisecta]|uniref:Uncharacterized protein n=1 Tax=[Myrmecia] bisecta TaxID=41462 RepID=A0AAW1PBB4_9CHLO